MGLREVGRVVCAVYVVSRLKEVLVVGHEIAMGGVWFGRRTLPQASGKWFMFAVCGRRVAGRWWCVSLVECRGGRERRIWVRVLMKWWWDMGVAVEWWWCCSQLDLSLGRHSLTREVRAAASSTLRGCSRSCTTFTCLSVSSFCHDYSQHWKYAYHGHTPWIVSLSANRHINQM